MTVTGPISADELGFTLIHEHLYYGMETESGDNWDRVYGRAVHDSDQIFEQLMEYKNAGGVTLVDQTTGGLCGKDGNILLEQDSLPVKHSVAVRQMAERTGLNIILGNGWYRVPFYDPYIYDIKTDELAEELVRDITEGLHGTDVKAGILGEIGGRAPVVDMAGGGANAQGRRARSQADRRHHRHPRRVWAGGARSARDPGR